MEWVELSIPVVELADEIAALLASQDEITAQGVQVRPTIDGAEEIVTWAPAAEADAAATSFRRAAARLAHEGFAIDPEKLVVRAAPPEDEWRDAWKKHFKVTRVTRRIVIVPSWETYTAQDGDVILDLDPGRAFGTGAHATTRLCLLELERLSDDGLAVRRFIDVGTGSGILAIAAAKLWPAAVGDAMDNDPQATSCARENLERNGVLARVRTSEDDPNSLPVGELVMANIQADVLEALCGALVARVAPGGALVLSGLLTEQARPVAEKFAAAGMEIVRVSSIDAPQDRDWSAVVLRRR
jgi:ribosomal protein L11 methyltransferase